MNAHPQTMPAKCLSCNAELTVPCVCQACHRLYPTPQSVDYFDLLGLAHKYDLDADELAERFRDVSRHVHPDFFAGASAEMRSLSVRLAAELNEAIRVLKDSVLRASYLLESSGGPSAADDRTVPPDVLADAMMLREQIDDARANDNAPQLRDLRSTVDQKRSELTARIADVARRLPEVSDDDKTQLRHWINSIKYYNNMIDLLWTV